MPSHDSDNAIVLDAHMLIHIMQNELPCDVLESVMQLLRKVKLNTIANTDCEIQHSYELICLVRNFGTSYVAASQYVLQYVNKN